VKLVTDEGSGGGNGFDGGGSLSAARFSTTQPPPATPPPFRDRYRFPNKTGRNELAGWWLALAGPRLGLLDDDNRARPAKTTNKMQNVTKTM
jgi:hypothetical protein